MDILFKAQDFFLVIVIPLMIVTMRKVKQNWGSLWDDDLTSRDRQLLLQASLFLLEPIIVFLHECGHAAATLYYGGTIRQFHFAVLSGYVIPGGTFTDWQTLVIFLAGNVVSIACGYICLALALAVRAPAMVALLVYLGLWSISSSAVMYALMSVVGVYGDWGQIYSYPDLSVVGIIAFCHVLIIASLIYMLMGRRPRLWFAERTRPKWYERFKQLRAALQVEPTFEHFLRMAWLFYEASLNDMAKEMLATCLKVDPDAPEPCMLYGLIAMNAQKFDKAEQWFMRIVHNDRASNLLKARAYMAVAHSRIMRAASNRSDPKKGLQEALEVYDAALKIAPDLGDLHFARATTLNELDRFSEATAELERLSELNWLDQSLIDRVPEQLEIARLGKIKPE